MVRGHPATTHCRRGRLPLDRWWPLAVAGGNQGVGRLFLKRVDVFSVAYKVDLIYSVEIDKWLPGIEFFIVKEILCDSSA